MCPRLRHSSNPHGNPVSEGRLRCAAIGLGSTSRQPTSAQSCHMCGSNTNINGWVAVQIEASCAPSAAGPVSRYAA